MQQAFDRFEFSKGLEAVWALISAVDKFIVEQAPWKLARQPDEASQKQLDDTLYTAAEALRIATALLSPVLPQSAPEDLGAARHDRIPSSRCGSTTLAWGGLPAGQKIGEVSGVFPRIEAEGRRRQDARAGREGHRGAGRAAGQEARGRRPRPRQTAKIPIDDFCKVDLRVGLVLSAERVKGSDKLMHMKVDIGEARAAHHRGRHRRSLHARAAARTARW